MSIKIENKYIYYSKDDEQTKQKINTHYLNNNTLIPSLRI